MTDLWKTETAKGKKGAWEYFSILCMYVHKRMRIIEEKTTVKHKKKKIAVSIKADESIAIRKNKMVKPVSFKLKSC